VSKEVGLGLAVQQLPAVMWTTDQELHITSSAGADVSQRARLMEHLVGLHALDDSYLVDDNLLLSRGAHKQSLHGVKASCELEWPDLVVQVHVGPLYDAKGEISGCVGVAFDITTRKNTERKLTYQASHDLLTGLHNRAFLVEQVTRAVGWARGRKNCLAVVYADIDIFKLINDGLGHAAGDELIVAVGSRLRRCVGDRGLLARLGGDEFCVVFEGAAAVESVRQYVEEMANCMRPRFLVAGQETCVTASFGVAIHSGRESAGELINNADAAMYHAKKHKSQRYSIYEPFMKTKALGRLELANELHRALERGEFRLHYQPIITLRTGQIAALEALIRWQHPKRGTIAPGEFIPLAEDNGVIVPIGEWVLSEACSRLRQWKSQYPMATSLMMSVNVSPRQLQQTDFHRKVSAILRDTGIPPESLMLEVTEGTSLLGNETAVDTLRHLRAMGIQVALDDFGVGEAALNHLLRLPCDVIKIDRSFALDFGTSSQSRALIRALVGFANDMGWSVVVEGVETEEAMKALRGLGCDKGQGYYFARPLPHPDIDMLLSACLLTTVAPRL
jgi:diguanylate cyclase (GGDEF)-like protein